MLKIDTETEKQIMYFSPFSPYQWALFLYDVVFLSLVLFIVFVKLNGISNFSSEKEGFQIILLTVPVLSFFPIYGLYSYHVIFRGRAHVKRMIKAFIWAFVSLCIIYFLYRWPHMLAGNNIYSGILLLIVAFLIAILGRFFSDYLAHFVIAIGMAFIFVGATGFVLKNQVPFFVGDVSKAAAALLLSLILVAMGRYFIVQTLYGNWLRRYFRRQIVILGDNKLSRKIIRYIIDKHAPYWVCGLVTLNNHKKNGRVKENNDLEGKKILGDVKNLPEILEANNANEILITDKSISKKNLITLLDFLVSMGRVAWFPPELLPIIPVKLNIDSFCGIPMIRMCLQRNPVFFEKIKRLTDIVLSSILILLLSPFLALVAIAIKLDSKGPILYLAEAVGKDGKRFKMFKFRSMYVDGDPNIHKQFVTKFIKGEIDKEKRKVLKITDDPRVTKVGKIIRRLSVDELPQLFNVFKGDMSLVGPRPCLPYEYELYKDWHRKRNSVVPGITGLWQIAGRSEVDFEEMILLDLYYIYNRNLLMDLAILFETIFVVFGMEGAY